MRRLSNTPGVQVQEVHTQEYFLGCFCSGGRLKIERRRQKSTEKTDCPFSFLAVEGQDGTWTLQHRGGASDRHMYRRHNHPPIFEILDHPHRQHRKLQGENLKLARHLITIQLPPREVVSVLAQVMPVPPLARHIAHVKRTMEEERQNGNAPIKAQLHENSWTSFAEKCPDGRLKWVFASTTGT